MPVTPPILTMSLKNRQFQPVALPAALQLLVTSYSWHVIGGPKQCTLSGTGSPESLFDMLDALRYAVTIRDTSGAAYWWGYIAEVRVQIGMYEFSVSLDTMANRVTVAYARIVAGQESAGERATTVWVQDTLSAGEYGIKEVLLSLSNMSDEGADLYRDNALRIGKQPVTGITFTGQSSLAITVTCRGWWETLGWRFYRQTPDAVAWTGPATNTAQWKPGLRSVAQQFTPTTDWRVSTIQFRMRAVGAPYESMRLLLYANYDPLSLAVDNGTFLGQITKDMGTLSQQMDWVTWELPGTILLTAGTVYTVVLALGEMGNGGWSDTSFVEVEYTTGGLYSGGSAFFFRDPITTWQANPAVDYLFLVGGLRTATTLMHTIRLTSGQFLTGDYSEQASDIYLSAYVDGEATALTVMEDLLALGSSTALRMLARIEQDRSLTIFPEPLYDGTNTATINPQGQIANRYGLALLRASCPVGMWVKLTGVVPAGSNVKNVSDPTKGFIDEAEYNAQTDAYTPRFRGQPDVFNLGVGG